MPVLVYVLREGVGPASTARLIVVAVAAAVGATAAGALAGATVNRRLPQQALGRAFAVLVALVAGLLLADTLILGGPPAA